MGTFVAHRRGILWVMSSAQIAPRVEGRMRNQQYITSSPGVQGGEPVIRDTRTPVRTVGVLFHDVYSGDRDAVQRALPHLSCEEIDAALSYYDAHRQQIDALIAEHHRILRDISIAR
jgi:uncharacterized protein (DUF433 family)